MAEVEAVRSMDVPIERDAVLATETGSCPRARQENDFVSAGVNGREFPQCLVQFGDRTLKEELGIAVDFTPVDTAVEVGQVQHTGGEVPAVRDRTTPPVLSG